MINLSLSSFLFTVEISNGLLIVLYFLLKSDLCAFTSGRKLLIVYLALTIGRLALPLELPMAKNVYYTQNVSRLLISLKRPLLENATVNLSVWSVILIIWLIGIIINVFIVLTEYHKLKQHIKKSENVSLQPLYQNSMRRLKQKNIDVSKFQIVKSGHIQSPSLFGFRKPYIVLPTYFDENEKELDMILAHEAAHNRGHDLMIKLLYQTICCFYWWNPFAWNVGKRINTILEMYVDEKLLAEQTEEQKFEYLQCLLKYAKAENGKGLELPFAQGKTILNKRFDGVINSRKIHTSKVCGLVAAMLYIAIYGVSLFYIIEPWYIEDSYKGETFELSDTNTYLIKRSNGTYDIYCDNEYVTTIQQLDDSLKNYETREE